MDNIKDKYDYIGEFHQGVAIVVKNDLYGAILMGGHEIISPTYDYISTFKDGYAQAIRKGECVTINLSGRKCVCCENKIIEIGEAYDEVRNFYNGLACVRQKDKWGVIDEKGNELVKPQFSCISDFINNVASYKSQNHKWGFITSDGNVSKDIYDDLEIDVDGSLITTRPIRTLMSTSNTKNYECKKVRLNHQGCVIIQTDSDLASLPSYVYWAQNVSEGIVCVQNLQGFWGAMTINGQQIIPFEYITLQDFNEGRTFGIDKNKRLHLLSLDGKSIKILDTFTDARPFIHGYASIYKNELCGLVDSFGEIVLLPGFSDINYSGIADYYILTKDDKEGIFQVSTKTVIPPLYQRIVSIEKEYIVVEIPVLGKCKIDFKGKCFVYHNDQVKYLPDWCLGGLDYEDDICYAISNTGKWGIVNIDGKTICNPIYDKLVKRENNLIYTESNNSTKDDSWKHEIYGLFDIETQVAIPAKYSEYPRKKENFYVISKCYKKYGAIDLYGNTVVNPEYSDVEWIDGYFKIFNERGIGLVKSDGTIIIKPQYHRIKFIGNGLFKVKSNHDSTTYALHFETGKISERMYDEIGTINEEGYIPIVYNGRNGFLNLSGQLIVFDEHENCIPVPDKFLWAEDFNHGVAKVWDDSWFDETSFDYIDRDFNKVLFVSDKVLKIEVIVDKIVYKNHNRCQSFIFKLGDKYGLLSKEGKLLVDAKYAHLDYYSENLYFASIKIEDEFYRKYGIIDEQENIILPFEYSNVESYCGVVLPRRAMWLIKRGKLNYILPKEISSYALIENEGYGLVNKKGEVILEPIYQTIIDFKNGYFVIEDNKWYIIDNKEFVKKETNYRSIRRLAHNFYETSVLISQTYNTYSGNYDEKKKYGILDEHGNVVLEPIYDSIGEFQEEQTDLCFTRITLNGSYGLIDNNFNIIAEPIYSYISDFKEGRAFAIKNNLHLNQSGFIGANGDFQNINSISSLEDLKGHVSKVEGLSNGYTIWQLDSVAENNKPLAIVNSSDDIVYSFKFHDIKLLSSGEYLVRLGEDYCGRFGLLDEQFKTIVEPDFEYVEHVEEVFIVSKNISYTEKAYGIIGLDGREIIPCIYGNIRKATQSLLWIETKDKERIGLADINGEILIEPKYGRVQHFENNLALVNCGYWNEYEEESYCHAVRTSREYVEGLWGAINKEGIEIVPPIYKSIIIRDDEYGFGFDATKEISIIGSHSQAKNVRLDCCGNPLICNDDGEYVLADKRFDYQENYQNGKSTVYYNGMVGEIDTQGQLFIYNNNDKTKGTFMLPSNLDWGYYFSEDVFVGIKDKKQGLFSSTGSIIIPQEYDSITIEDDYYKVCKGNKRGLFSKMGDMILDVMFDKIESFCLPTSFEKFYICVLSIETGSTWYPEFRYCMYDDEGHELLPAKYKQIRFIGHELFVVQEVDEKFRIINKRGVYVNSISFDKVCSFGDKNKKYYSYNESKVIDNALYSIVKCGPFYGAINTLGELVLQAKYEELFCVNRNVFNADGINIDSTGRKVAVLEDLYIPINDDYYPVELLDNGFLIVKQNNLYGCVNQVGDVVLPIQYNNLSYSCGLFIASWYDEVNEICKNGVIDFQNKMIVQFDSLVHDIKIQNNLILFRKEWNHWGAYSLNGNKICDSLYNNITFITENVLKVCTEDSYSKKYGLIDFNGNELYPLDYDIRIGDKLVNGLIEISVYGRLGYLDALGHIILKPTYTQIKDFVDNLAIVSKDIDGHRYGVIDRTFKEIIPCIYSELSYNKKMGLFETSYGYKTIDGRSIVNYDNQQIYLNSKYKYCCDFEREVAIAINQSYFNVKYALVNTKSQDVLPPIFDHLSLWINNIYKFKIDGKYGLVDSNGKIVVSNIYDSIAKIEDDLASVIINIGKDENGKDICLHGFINESGKQILPPLFEYMGKRSENKVVVMKNQLWGLFDIVTQRVTNILNIDYLGLCKDGLCRFNVGGNFDKLNSRIKDGIWGYMDNTGKIIISPKYERANGFSEGVAAVKRGGKWGFIDRNGLIIVPCEYDKVESNYTNGKGKLVKNDRIYVFDKEGKQISSHEQENDEDVYYGGYDDEPSIYDNPYYNDNLDMDQQSIDFWNSL